MIRIGDQADACGDRLQISWFQFLQQQANEKFRSWPTHAFLHENRDCNQIAGRLTSEALRREKSSIVTFDQDLQDLIALNRLNELLMTDLADTVVNVATIPRSALRRRNQPRYLQEEIVQKMRINIIKQAHNE